VKERKQKVVMLAANTVRSQAYAQALAHAEISVENVVLFGEDLIPKRMSFEYSAEKIGVFYPDLTIPLENTLGEISSQVIVVEEVNVNSQVVVSAIAALNADLIIYSGYGGQLVGSDMLNLNVPLLHMHAGWLPDYRGSTTIYYSLLNDHSCGVSAIFLDEKIDSGAIVARKKYPAPSLGIDIDYVYDNAIRADLLVDVVSQYRLDGEVSTLEQEGSDGEVYYVIHPVLKHIAMLALGDEER